MLTCATVPPLSSDQVTLVDEDPEGNAPPSISCTTFPTISDYFDMLASARDSLQGLIGILGDDPVRPFAPPTVASSVFCNPVSTCCADDGADAVLQRKALCDSVPSSVPHLHCSDAWLC